MNLTNQQSPVTIYLGADHGGFALKEKLEQFLSDQQYEVKDLGAHEYNPQDDYPVFAKQVAQAVSESSGLALGILVCTSGAGMVIAANKQPGVRAVEAFNRQSAQHAREHNHANVIALSGAWLTEEEAISIVQTFLAAEPSDGERHVRRISQISKLEGKGA